MGQKRCVPCEGGAEPLDRTVAESLLQQTLGWELSEDAKSITRRLKFKNFKEALDFTNKVGEIAENENHHPNIALSWGEVGIKLSTHSIGGLSENDFIIATKINGLYV